MNLSNQIVLNSTVRLALPIAVYPGLALTGAKVSDIVTNPHAQIDDQMALRERHASPFVLSAMDLSAEAEAFGWAGRRIASRSSIATRPTSGSWPPSLTASNT